ncbi:hypothetical protein EHQ82_06690 [Leptospira selangorensis]|uniref:Uncharacterized protein n=1 Tax=Leptospira selangorensis TaxID=2484982 RepID=A0ABY2NF36_9LEPT|nr:hypothetical protein EHQ82_06690 [Leptospira selangorensis]
MNCDLQKALLVVDINEISKLSRSDIEAKYGKPIEIGHDKSIKYDQISYSINDNEVYIEYEKNKPIWILILNPKKAKFDPNPLIYFNFDALTPNFSSYAVKRWNTVPGFKEISVVSDQKGGLSQIVFNISRKFKNEMQ